ncbi:carbohydrate ABC transporter permease [Saliphagus infecundisoli]|uniref:Carbohydrate ABC transporter permease n=1 Tax=Saliphagus infecundisoli TaxID=1849069 RepID=A0ABD5QAH8_9EURY|nr:carbohydrate ABC transporter permease [Saliphagus infecundisoli]
MATKTDQTSHVDLYDSFSNAVPKNAGLHALLLFTVGIIATPLILALIFSTQSLYEIYTITDLMPGSEGFSNYVELFTEWNFLTYMINSFIMASIIVTGKIIFSICAATAIVYYDFPYKDAVFFLILMTLMFPLKIRIVPLFELMAVLNWSNSIWAITIPYISSATTVFLLRQYFLSIPDSYVETARLDGVGPLKFLVYVVLPMAKGFLVGVGVIRFIGAWNQYLWPLVVINDQSEQVVQVGVRNLQQAAQSGFTDWSLIMAGSIVALLPPLIILIIFHRPLLDTMTMQQK